LHRVHRAGGGGRRAKTVDYWAARVTGGEFTVNNEVDRLQWLPFDAAVEQVDYDADRAVLALARARRAGARTVGRVRPAHAGPRGQDQAERLTAQLTAFGVDRLHAASPDRCVQTVAPLARLLGTAVKPVPELSEKAFRADPQAGFAALARIAADPRASRRCAV